MMKTITKFMTLCALFVGVNVSAQTTVLYERGFETEWSETDLEKWTSSSVIDTKEIVDNTLHFAAGKRGYEIVCGETITSDATSVIEWTGSWKLTNVASGYGFIKLGDIELRADRTGFKGTVVIGGVETVFSGLNRTELQDGAIWNYSFRIDKARGSVSYTIDLPSSEDVVGTGNTVNALTSLSVGFVRDRANGSDFSIVSIKLTETKQEVETASYAVKFVDGNGVNIKEAETRTGVVDAGINIFPTDKESFFNSDKTKKYFYVSDDREGKTIASDGSTVVTITYREAETFSYSVKSSTGTTIAKGSNFEGESITIPYPMYVNEDGVLYQADAVNKEYNHVFTLTTNAQEEVITYNETEIVDVVVLVEAETLLGMTPSAGNGGTAAIRSSNSKVAYPAEDALITTIPAGKYRIVVDIYGGQSTPGELTMTIDEASHTFTSVSSTYHSIQSWDVELTKEESPLMALKGGGNGVAYDFIYIIKTGNVTPISDINADKAVDNDYYDLSGRKVVNPVKGNIYINGGKLIRY